MLISELARETGVTPRTIRLYEHLGLLSAPARRPTGQRRYNEESIARMHLIRRIKAGGLPLARIAEILRAIDNTSDSEVARTALETLEMRLELIREHRRELLAVERDLMEAIADLKSMAGTAAVLRRS